MLIGFGHQAQVGKDLAASWLVQDYGFHRLAFADALKKACKEIFGWHSWDLTQEQKAEYDGFYDMTPREQLQRVGVALRSAIEEDIWVARVELHLLEDLQGCNVVITDVRFPNEVNMVRRYGGVYVKVLRPGVAGVAGNHVSETSLAAVEPDYTLVNDSTESGFRREVERMLQSFGVDDRRRG
jgi:hypothetical protein